jgi:hypothetical protein
MPDKRPYRVWTTAMMREFAADWTAGMSSKAMQKKWQMTQGAVCHRRIDCGLAPRHEKPLTRAQHKIIAHLADQLIADVSLRFGRNETPIKSALVKHLITRKKPDKALAERWERAA